MVSQSALFWERVNPKSSLFNWEVLLLAISVFTSRRKAISVSLLTIQSS